MKLWFKAKNYGWGWYPSTWQGWAVLAVFVALIALNAFRLDTESQWNTDTILSFVIETLSMLSVLLVICWLTGEEPRWRWGRKDTNKE